MAPTTTDEPVRRERQRRPKRQGRRPDDVAMGDSRDRSWLPSPLYPDLLDLAQDQAEQEGVTPQVILWRWIAAGALAHGVDVPEQNFVGKQRPDIDAAAPVETVAVSVDGFTPAQTMRALASSAYRIEETVGTVLNSATERKDWNAMASVATAGQKAHELGEALESAEQVLRS